MCTAVSFISDNCYFGRNLDYEYSFNEKVIIIPRNFSFEYKKEKIISSHYAIMGMGIIEDEYPLMFDCMNEHGLAFAGLNFPENAVYRNFFEGKINLTPYELPLWILGNFKCVNEIKYVLKRINLLNLPFSDKFSLTPLHFVFADKNEMLVYEFTEDGGNIYINNTGVLTNNPVFPVMINELNKYTGLSVKNPCCDFMNILCESNGMGAIGLPGDLSSRSRFIRATFNLANIYKEKDNIKDVTQFFHLLNSVYQQKGCVITESNGLEKTIYSSCMNLDKRELYYTTYENSQITCIMMKEKLLKGNELISYPLMREQNVLFGN